MDPSPFLLLLATSINLAKSFNVDVNSAETFAGPPSSYFGYTVALHKNADGHWLLVGAPKANSTFLKEKFNIIESGTLAKCQLGLLGLGDSARCVEMVVDPLGNVNANKPNSDQSYKDLKDGGWLGVSLDVRPTDDGQIVVCAHQWKNQRYVSHYLTNGVCYVVDSDLRTPAQKLTPLVDYRKQIVHPGVYYHAMGQAGLASHYTEKGTDLVLGAPGVLDWTGTIVYYSEPNAQSTNKYSAPIIPLPMLEIPDVIYFGYSISSGKFFSDGLIWIVVGAPRDDHKGRVYIISQPQRRNREQVLVKMRKEGTQMGEYFGASVCGVDLNGDGLTDLVVGAPQHAITVNEGRIYVFINDGRGFLKPVRESIMGDAQSNSHFGTAIGAIGDINQDDYQDIAVGAPYEAQMGAVYIYRGSERGINHKYVQKILAKQLHPTFKGFGISFSRGKDMDDNFYPDFAVGAYESGHAVLLKTRPTILVKANLLFEPTQIMSNMSGCQLLNGTRLTSGCVLVHTCISFTGKHVYSHLDIDFTLTSDIFKPNGSRVYFDQYQQRQIKSTVRVSPSNPTCQVYQVQLKRKITDFLTPITFEITFNLNDTNSKNEKSFCKDCPLVDPSCPLTFSKQLTFKKNCGDDDICEADLQVIGVVENYGLYDPFVIGSEKHLNLDFVISNKGEPAFETTLHVVTPRWGRFKSPPPTCIVQSEENELICHVANPLTFTEEVKIRICVNVENVASGTKEAIFNATVSTTSEEESYDLLDNVITLVLPLKAVADVTISGISTREQIILGAPKSEIEDKLTFSHKYEVTKFEPSPIESVTMEINIPVSSSGQNTLFHIRWLKFHESTFGNGVFGSCEGLDLDDNVLTTLRGTMPPTSDSNGRSIRAANNTQKNDQSHRLISSGYKNLHQLNCSSAHCHTIRCLLGNLAENESMSLEIGMQVDADNLQTYMTESPLYDNIELISSAQVFINDDLPDIQPAVHKPDFAQVSTVFVSGVPLKGKPPSVWIIVLSCLAGCLLLLLLTLVLVKLGFFRRQQREEMRQLMQFTKTDNSMAIENLLFDAEE